MLILVTSHGKRWRMAKPDINIRSRKHSPAQEISDSGARSGLSSVAGIGLAAVLLAAITAALYAKAGLTRTVPEAHALTVNTVVYKTQTAYQRQVSYLGLVVAGRKANLSFENPGLIATLPVRQGSPVHKGDVIATLDNTLLKAKRAATAADLKQARAELELARLRADRQQELQKSGAVSRDIYDQTRLHAQALAAQVEGMSARLHQLDIEVAKSTLVAPYAGIVADRYVEEGTVIDAGIPVVKLVATRAREAHIGVSVERAQQLNADQSYSLRLRDKTIPARLLTVRPDVDARTRTTTVIFALPDTVATVDGEPVTLQLDESVPTTGGWLPLTALLEGQRGVWNVLRLTEADDGLRTVREAVEVLDVQGERAYVRGTLPANSEVVATGLHRITPGALVVEQGEP